MDNELSTVDKYKYLGIYLDEHITFEHCPYEKEHIVFYWIWE